MMSVVSYGCPNCHGGLYVESFREEGKRFTEIICLNCARLWTPGRIGAILAAHKDCCTEESIARYKRGIEKRVALEGVSTLVAVDSQ